MGVKAWITVNGNHIPIMDGESKMQAVGRFIKDKKSKLKEKYEAQKNKASEALRKSGNENRRVKDLNTEAINTYMKLQEQRKTIKGIGKTPAQKNDERITKMFFDEYKKGNGDLNEIVRALSDRQKSESRRRENRFKLLSDDDRVYTKLDIDDEGWYHYKEGRYEMSSDKHGGYQAKSHHAYDLTDYSYAKNRDGDIQGKWTVYNPTTINYNTGKTKIDKKEVNGFAAALRQMKKWDKEKKARIDRT